VVQNVKEWLTELALNAGKNLFSTKLDEKKLKLTFSDYLNGQQKYNEICALAEEIDFQGLVEYIEQNLSEAPNNQLFSPSRKSRNQARNDMIAAAVEYSGAKTNQAKSRVENIISACLDIIYGFYASGISKEEYILAAKIVDAVNENMEELAEAIASKIEDRKETTPNAAQLSIDRAVPPASGEPCLTAELIESEQQRLKNEVLLPWMKNSASYDAVFPELFIEPKLNSLKLKGALSYEELDRYRNRNIAIIGNAGVGKTTLLRYLFLYKNHSGELLYVKASSLCNDPAQLNSYEKCIRDILLGAQRVNEHHLILLDGVDEAYADDSVALQELMLKISGLEQVSVWFGWRGEHYYQHETEAVRSLLYNVVSLQDWNTETAQRYVQYYGEKTGQENIITDFQTLLRSGEDIESFTKSPFQLTLLVYLLENKEYLPEIQRYFASKDRTIFGLYDQFLECWLEKERDRGTSFLPASEIVQRLQRIAGKLYYGSFYELEEDSYRDSAIAGLLTFSALKNKRQAIGFYHRSFCAFFCAKEVFNAVIQGGATLVKAMRIPMRNDVTDFVRSAISVVTETEIRDIQKHLIDTYLEMIRPDTGALDSEAKSLIQASTPQELFYLKNELIYLVTRIPDPAGLTAPFLEVAHEYETNPHLKLDIAYGAVLTGPSWIALEYAGSLVPGSESDLIHRSWTIAYFGDVQANPYYYRDVKREPWTKSRTVRLKRFQSNKRKAIRFRILDIPLMYCFYASRDWKDVNETDYEIIKQTAIDCSAYTKEEKIFLKEQKRKLVEEFQKHLTFDRKADEHPEV